MSHFDECDITVEYLSLLESRIVSAWPSFAPIEAVSSPPPAGFSDEFAQAERLWQPLRLFQYDVYSAQLRQSMPLIFLDTPLAFYHWAAYGIETIKYIAAVAFACGRAPDFDAALDFDVALHGYSATIERHEEFCQYASSRSFSAGPELLGECRSLFGNFSMLFKG